VDLLHRVSLLASEHTDLLELDLNPVLALPGEAPCMALDARVRLGAPAGKGATEAKAAATAVTAGAPPR